MSDADYLPVEVALDDTDQLEDVHLEVLGMKLDLPNLGSANLPLELVQVVLLIKSKPVLDDETLSHAAAVFLAYFQEMRPDFWNRLRSSANPMAYLMATVRAWADQSGLSPKAVSSSGSTRSTGPR